MGVIKRIACTALSAMMMLSFGAIGVNAEALSSSSEDSLSLAWDIVDEADGYVIYRIDDSGELQEIANVEECRYTDEGLEPNTETIILSNHTRRKMKTTYGWKTASSKSA